MTFTRGVLVCSYRGPPDMRPRAPCAQPGCPAIATGRGFCDSHQPPRRERTPDAPRPSPASRGYDATWRRIRQAHLRAEPQCRECGQPAVLVDHITPLRHGGTNDPANLQSLCGPCHNRKTARYDGGWGNAR